MSFRYTAQDGSATNRFRHAFVFGGERQSKVVTFTIPAGAPLGSFSVTGVGFQPEAVLIMGINQATDEASAISKTFSGIAGMHVGMAVGTDQWCGSIGTPDLGSGRHKLWSDAHVMAVTDEGGALDCEADLDSFDADGFTLNVTTGPANDMLCIALAVRGENMAIGTALAPAAAGTQAITGLGFQPSAVMFFSVQAVSLDTDENDWRWLFGAASDPSVYGSADPFPQYACWAGARAGDNYSHQLVYDDTPLFFAIDAGPAGPPTEPFNPTVLSVATLDSFDADGFTLSWAEFDATYEVGVQRYFGWLAIDAPAEVLRWVYNHTGDGAVASQSTFESVRALIFFNNQLGVNSTRPTTDDEAVDPAVVGIGVAGRRPAPVPGQGHISVAEWSQPPFDVQQSGSIMYVDEGFGNLSGTVGGIFGNIGISGDDRGIVRLGRDHLLRLHVGP